MHILKHILNIIFLALCKQCGSTANNSSFTSSFCNNCWNGIEWFEGALCQRCGMPFPSFDDAGNSSHTCGDCIKNPPYFDKAISAGPYKDVLAEAIKLFKYKKKIHIGRALAEEVMKLITCETSMGGLPTKEDENHPTLPPLSKGGRRVGEINIYVAIPVPLHPQRLREREFNQSAIIASVISSRLAIPMVTNVLFRQRCTKPQVELGFRERKENVADAFTLQNKEAIKGRNIILIDDVFTTGSTVNECAKVLKKNGAEKVYVVTIARMI